MIVNIYSMLMAATLLLAAGLDAHAGEPCIARAAAEFGVPAAVLDAMRQEERPALNPATAAREFGPMGLSEPALQAAKAGASIDPARAKREACENYRAAAWLLSDARKRSGGDLWTAVKLYRGRGPGAEDYARRVQIAARSN